MEPEAYQEMAELEGHHWWYVGMRQITARMLEPFLDGQRDLTILDAGCGTGADMSLLADYGHAVGLDFSPLAVSYTHQQHPGRVTRASVASMPYPDNTFDLVASLDVLYAREVGDDRQAITEMARITGRGGLVLIRVAALPILRGPHDILVHGVRRYTARDIRLKLIGAGLIPLRLTYANSLLMPLAFASRIVQNIGAMLGRQPSSDVRRSQGVLDRFMLNALRAEARWIGAGRNFAAGVSLFALGRKP